MTGPIFAVAVGIHSLSDRSDSPASTRNVYVAGAKDAETAGDAVRSWLGAFSDAAKVIERPSGKRQFVGCVVGGSTHPVKTAPKHQWFIVADVGGTSQGEGTL